MSLVIKEYTFSGTSAIVDLPNNNSIPRLAEYTGAETRVWIEVDAPDVDGATFQMSFVVKKQFESVPDNTYTYLGSYWNNSERMFVYYKGL